MYSPPLFTPFGYGGFGYSPIGFMPINFNLLVLGAMAYVAYSVLSNRAGGSDFAGGRNAEQSGATVLKLSIALESNWAARNNIMNTLARIANKNSALSTRQDLSNLLSEASLSLLRAKSDWTAVSYDTKSFSERNSFEAEPTFQQMAVRERSKFEEETMSVATIRPSEISSAPTQVVVSILVAIQGDSNAYKKDIKQVTDVAACLERLAAEALTDEGSAVMAVEVLWTPSEPGNTLSKKDLIMNYPELLEI